MNNTVCVIRDDRYLEHKTGLSHPEHPNRLASLHRLLDREFAAELPMIAPIPARMDQIELVHTPAYIMKVMKTAEHKFTYLAPDTPAGDKSYMAAWLAVGGCIKALDMLMSGQYRNAFALVRPPGHHALPDRAGGFCIFNNLAVTARQAVAGYRLERILIVDWDVHHGHGIQEVFYDDRRVLYFSSHYIGAYPAHGRFDETGRGSGAGYTINVPVPKNMEDGDILHCYRDILGPVTRWYKPQLILIAAGFDGHLDDPTSRTSLTEKAYGRLMRLILDLGETLGKPPILLALEGGYDVRALTCSVREVLTALTGGEHADIPITETRRGAEMVEKAWTAHASYDLWTREFQRH